MEKNKYYIRLDSNNYIIKGFSDAFEQPIQTDIYIGEGERHFELNGVINPSLFNSDGVPLYKWNGNVVSLTDADIQAYKATLPQDPPSLEDRLKAMEDALLNII